MGSGKDGIGELEVMGRGWVRVDGMWSESWCERYRGGKKSEG